MSPPAPDELVGGSSREPTDPSGTRVLRVAVLLAVLAGAAWLAVRDDAEPLSAGQGARQSSSDEPRQGEASVVAGGSLPSPQPGPLTIHDFCLVRRTAQRLTVGVDLANGGPADLTVHRATATAVLGELRPMHVELPAASTCHGEPADQAEVVPPGGGLSVRLTMPLPERCRTPAVYQVAVSFVRGDEGRTTQQLRVLTATPDTTDPCTGQQLATTSTR